jgi:hypothetical protein
MRSAARFADGFITSEVTFSVPVCPRLARPAPSFGTSTLVERRARFARTGRVEARSGGVTGDQTIRSLLSEKNLLTS